MKHQLFLFLIGSITNCDTFNDVKIDLTINKNIFHFHPPAGGKAGRAGGKDGGLGDVGSDGERHDEQKPPEEDEGQRVNGENVHKEQHQPFKKGDS